MLHDAHAASFDCVKTKNGNVLMHEARDTWTPSIIIITCLGMSTFEFGFVFHGNDEQDEKKKFSKNNYGKVL